MSRRLVSVILTSTAAVAIAFAMILDSAILFPWALPVIASLVVAGLVTWRAPGSPVGWLMMSFAWVTSVSLALFAIASTTPDPARAGWFDAIGNMINTAGVMALPALMLRFPDGELLARRWKPVEWMVAVAALAGAAAAMLNGGWGGDVTQAVGIPPFRDATAPLGDILTSIFYPLMAGSMVLAGISVVIRFRRSRGEERLKIKWLGYSGAFLVTALLVLAITGDWNVALNEGWEAALGALAFASIPAAMGVAVLRYRLYDIDVVISKTLVFGSLAIVIAGLYVGIVLVLGSALGVYRPDAPDTVLSIAALVIIPIVFQPARRWLERWANRVVYGRKATPYEVLSSFSQKIAAVDPGVLTQIARSLAEGTTAESAAIWSISGSGRRLVAAWPNLDGIPSDLIRSAPIVHDGDQLGEVTLVLGAGQTLLPTDERLLGQVSAGLGLALRNLALTEDLRDRVEQLRESRSRVVAVQDGTRRRLERDLHDGAQQRLVALKIKLGLASAMAQKEGISGFDELLEGLKGQADRVIDTVREFARGVYPPLLEAEGLVPALNANFRKASIPVSLQAGGVGRYPKEVEATTYFCVLQAVQHAVARNAGSVQVFLGESEGSLTFEARDDGVEVDHFADHLVNLVDRLDASGGSLEVTSRAGHGTLLVGKLAAEQLATT